MANFYTEHPELKFHLIIHDGAYLSVERTRLQR